MGDKSKVIAVDVDGTLTVGPMPEPGQFAAVQTGTRAFLGALRDRGYQITVFSARSPVELVRQFFKRQDLDRFVDSYSRVKPRAARIFLDDRAVQFRGDFRQALQDIDNFKPHWEEGHSYGYSAVELPADLAQKVRALGARIPDADLDPEEGREQHAHVTCLYGFTDDDSRLLQETVAGFGPVKVKLGNLSLFENPKHDVLKLEAESPDLHRLRAVIVKRVPHVETHPEYKPHVTVAYLKPGKGSEHLMLDNPLRDQEFTASALEFADRKKNRASLRL